ncbi:toxin-antitoxin system YwqK family antitoxin [Candidatus Woesearchaeota archaeon]|jgi:hypothetical protein|nr:toxin-antitoxin system YwqK family antitoxin [Candidatus Woesearchaeota archaeon]MBT6518544.1 toxin-antitoxin system YwqK family antitoxin [Candidatus Woesearchaeota archaeon]MBT7368416.1 toxin-antitoxin system YwqK family antitoxin [Candidatus Woesearchaeota archaeon]
MNEKIFALIIASCVAVGSCNKIEKSKQEQKIKKCEEISALPDPYSPMFLQKICCYHSPNSSKIIPVKSTDNPVPLELFCENGDAKKLIVKNQNEFITDLVRMSNGKLEGLQEGWHENGQQSYKEYFTNDLHIGVVRTWYSDGQKESEETWKNGELDGKKLKWHENGKLWADDDWKNGERHGESNLYDRKGNLFKTVKWEHNKRVKEIQHSETFQF